MAYITAEARQQLLDDLAGAIEAIGDALAALGAAYEKAWSAATRDYRVLTRGLLAAARSPLRRGIVPLAAAAPGLYGTVVERLAR